MKNIFAMTSNAELFFSLATALERREKRVPGLGLVFGEPGLGKTRTASYYVDRLARTVDRDQKPIFIRALANDTPRSFLETMVAELGQEPLFRTTDLYRQAENAFRETPRLLIVDEIDRLASNWKAIETLRDLTDQTGIPILMIGMGESERKLARFRHLYYRMKAHILRFAPLGEADIRRFVDQVAEVSLDDSAVGVICEKSGGRIGEIIPEIVKAEKIGKANDLKTIKGNHLLRSAA
jgi:Cdc6-like AAA superfamily ATPase